MARRKEPRIPDAILDQLLGGADPKTAFNPNGLLDDLKKALAERVLNAEMDHHLVNGDGSNTRNGYGKKTVVTDTSRLELDVPRDRQSSFDPQLIAKYQRRFPGFDEKIISMYARGMSVREIVGHLRDLYSLRLLAQNNRCFQVTSLSPGIGMAKLVALIEIVRDKSDARLPEAARFALRELATLIENVDAPD
jgi:hypothetical protein